ncbi:MAG: hypothetical protein U5K73_12305 [Halofilum sp. (in: g-proteobacteria)]|nr:hypothetical protein [Halofilum sp. (in: g-proteobacteria)]
MTTQASDEPVRLGLLAPMTGTNAIQGQDMDRRVRLAIERINAGYDVPPKNGETRRIGPGSTGPGG